MKNLLRNSLLVSACVLTGAVAFSPKAQAQPTDVDFEGPNPPVCTVNSVSPGTLVSVSASRMTADAYTFDSSGAGTAARINVTCNGGTTFTVVSVVDNNSTGGASFGAATGTAANSNKGVTIRNADTGVQVSSNNVGTSGSVVTGPINAQDYAVQLDLFASSTPLPVGVYRVRAVVNLLPQ